LQPKSSTSFIFSLTHLIREGIDSLFFETIITNNLVSMVLLKGINFVVPGEGTCATENLTTAAAVVCFLFLLHSQKRAFGVGRK
jgi:hypothetical protein